jgi:ABC-type uncharacterized transport system substrate-binding protein
LRKPSYSAARDHWSHERAKGEITGFTMFEVSIFGKTLALLKQIAPAITHVAFIYNPDNPNTVVYRRTIENAAGPLAVEPIAVPIHGFCRHRPCRGGIG